MELHRRYVGIELNPAFNTEAIQRLKRHRTQRGHPSRTEGTEGEGSR